MNRTVLRTAFLLILLTAFAAFAEPPKGWSKLAKGWIPAIAEEGTYDPSQPDEVAQRVVDTLLAVQKDGINPDYLKRIDSSGTTLKNVVFWAVQGKDAATITRNVLATPGAQKTPPRGSRKPKKP